MKEIFNSGYANSQNCHYWATENTCDIQQETLLSEKIIVWCGVALFWVDWYTFLRKQGRWGSNSKFSLLP